MKRYYLDKLNFIQTLIKILIINILLTIFTAILTIISRLGFGLVYIVFMVVIYQVVIIKIIIESIDKSNIYLKDGNIYYCTRKKEEVISLDLIDTIEEYIGVDYLFGKKSVIIHLNRRKYKLLFNKQKADLFIKWLNKAIENREHLDDIDSFM